MGGMRLFFTPRRAAWAWLLLAICSGASGTSALSQARGFTLPEPTLLALGFYALCFVALTRAVRSIPISVAYAVWSGLGIALVSVIGWVLFGQALGLGELLGIALILAGTVVIQLYSRAARAGD
jgi:small multidrug resistance pump